MGTDNVNGRYIPIATGKTGRSMSIRTSASTIPTSTYGHSISPPSTPWIIPFIRNAWGAGSCLLPMVNASCKTAIISPITPLWSPMKTKYEHIVVDKSELITEKEYEKVKKDIDLFGKLENLDAWYKW